MKIKNEVNLSDVLFFCAVIALSVVLLFGIISSLLIGMGYITLMIIFGTTDVFILNDPFSNPLMMAAIGVVEILLIIVATAIFSPKTLDVFQSGIKVNASEETYHEFKRSDGNSEYKL